MLLAYIDEIGEPGAFVAPDHPRFNTSPAFGYAGFVLPEDAVRPFGAHFTQVKRELFKTEIAAAKRPEHWERKGSELFRPHTPDSFPQHLRGFDALVSHVCRAHGHLFYYADEKPRGTPKQTRLDESVREAEAMRETLNRLARHADYRNENIMVIIDQINEKTRIERIADMYAHVLGRASEHREMKRISEPPMHVDSKLSSNVQFADWIAACVTRAIDRQMFEDSRYGWIADPRHLKSVAGSFTYESKLHLWQKDVEDLHHSQLFRSARPLLDSAGINTIAHRLDSAAADKMRKIYNSSRPR